MTNFSNWVLGFCAAVMGVGGLFVASHVGHGVGYYGGLAIFLFAVFFVFFIIRTTLDHEEGGH
ncbi:MAG: hypothetical protein VX700_01425 [Pseudomonadota bacterium]|nr:hypothetical protein [Pseudomonadota bacterium]